jgi:serine phosphatase RsbU (regulator of sigma subunit)
MIGCAVFGSDGTLLTSDQPSEWWQTLQDSSDLDRVRSRRRWGVSNLQQAADGELVFTIATPIPRSRNVLRTAIKAAALRDQLDFERAPGGPRTGWRVLIVDRRGRLIYHSADTHRPWEKRDWSGNEGIRQALLSGEGRQTDYRSAVDGERCVAHYLRVDRIGWIVGSSSPLELEMAGLRREMALELGRIALACALSLLLVFVLGAHLSRPIERLAVAAEALGRGEDVLLDEEGKDETALLARTFNGMALRVRERFNREHAIASTLQRAFLPTEFPDCPGYDFDAAYHPALREAEVGGDFYDLFELPGGRIGILLGDVSGKGLPAAVYASMTRYLARAYGFESSSPADVLRRVNQALCTWLSETEVFVTAFYAVLEPSTHTLRYANAGHWPALLARPEGTEMVGGGGIALGVLAASEYSEGHLQLAPGDEAVLYSDGLIEVGAQDSMSHLESVQRSLARDRQRTLRERVVRLHEDALARNGGELRDDVAILALRRGQTPVAAPASAPSAEARANPHAG